jgi:chitin-binding protein
VTVTAGSAGAKDWTVTLPRPSGRLVTSWGAVVRQDGANLTAAGQRWNAALTPGAGTAFGFVATGTPTAVPPTCSSS